MATKITTATDWLHPQYLAMEAKETDSYTVDPPGVWTKMRDCLSQRAIKDKSEAYLPMSPGLRAADDTSKQAASYRYYKHNASFPSVLKRFVSSMVGLWFQQETKYELPDALQPILGSATTDDKTLHAVEWQIAKSQAVEGRIGVLCEPDVSQNGVVPPDLVRYEALAILNWQTIYDYLAMKEREESGFTKAYYKDGGTKYGAKFVILDESYTNFAGEETALYRVLALDAVGKYYTATFDDSYDMNTFDPDVPNFDNIVYPGIAGKTINFIPFTIINSDEVGFDVRQPALAPVADGALSIYNKDALLQQCLQISAQPFPFFKGFTDADIKKLAVMGSTMCAYTANDNADVKYVESDGSAVAPLREEITKQLLMIEKFGVELVESGTESGAALSIRVDVKTASLKEMAIVRQEGMEDILINCLLMMNQNMTREQANDEITVTVNTEFKGEIASVEQLRIYLEMFNMRKITDEELSALLYKAGVVTEEDYNLRQIELERQANLSPTVGETILE